MNEKQIILDQEKTIKFLSEAYSHCIKKLSDYVDPVELLVWIDKRLSPEYKFSKQDYQKLVKEFKREKQKV